MIKDIVQYLVFRNPRVADAIKRLLGSKSVGDSRLYKAAVLRRARDIDAGFSDTDIALDIETTLNCNAKCVMCLHGYETLSGTMPMPLFERIIDMCVAAGVRKVGLSVYGEPFLDPYFTERVKYLRRHGLGYYMSTNATLLNRELAEELFRLGGLGEINFSLNGFSKEAYERVMSGLDRETAYRNVTAFVALKNALGRKDPVVSVSCVKTKFNRGELRRFEDFWKNQRGVERIRTIDLRDRTGDHDVEKDIGDLGPLNRRGVWPGPCRELWNRLIVYHDGRVAPCCLDTDKRELIVGDLNAQSLTEVANGEALRGLRALHRGNRRKDHPVCGACSFHSVWFFF